MDFKTNTELFEAIENLQQELSSSGREEVSSLISEGMSGLNGLTDGWAYLLEHLDSAKLKYGSSFTSQQNAKLSKIQKVVHRAVYRA